MTEIPKTAPGPPANQKKVHEQIMHLRPSPLMLPLKTSACKPRGSSSFLSIICSFFLLAATAAAKSLQWCLTLCDPRDGSPPGSSVHGIFTYYIIVVHTEQVLYIIINYC